MPGSPSAILSLSCSPTSIRTGSTTEFSISSPFLRNISITYFTEEISHHWWHFVNSMSSTVPSSMHLLHIDTTFLLLSEDNASTCALDPIVHALSITLHYCSHIFPLSLSLSLPLSPSLFLPPFLLPSPFQQYSSHSHGNMFGPLLSYKLVLLGPLLATSWGLTFHSCLHFLSFKPLLQPMKI